MLQNKQMVLNPLKNRTSRSTTRQAEHKRSKFLPNETSNVEKHGYPETPQKLHSK